MKPTIGRIVHYMRFGSPGGEHKPEPSPAVITAVDADGTTCHLFVMNPNGCYFNKTPFSPDPKPGHWSWMPYQKEQARKEVEQISNLVAIQKDCVAGDGSKGDEYMRGMANGLICAEAVLKGIEPKYIDPPAKCAEEKVG